jgi:hypothetical protein
VEQDGKTFDVCERADVACESLAKEQLKDPSDKWNGCARDAIITKSHFILAGLIAFSTHVLIVASYVDSERVDMTVTFEQTDHTFRKYVRRDVPIVIRENIPRASADFVFPDNTLGVPTVEATEKGGKKEASHSYK